MKKSQQANQINAKSAQSAQQGETRTITGTKSKAKIRSFASGVALTTSRHFGALSRFLHLAAAKSISTRHFRANSYVPLLLALRPRAGVTERSAKNRTNFVQYAGQKWHFYQFCPLRWTKFRFLSQSANRRSSLVGRPAFALVFPFPMLTLGLIFVLSLGFSLLGLVVFPTSTFATSLTLSIPAEPLAISITPTQDGTFNSANSKITVKTDAPFGYELKVKSASVDNSLTSSSGGGSSITAILPSITSAISESTFRTDTTYNNKWGFKPSKLAGTANDSYQPAPDSTGLLIDKTTQATDLTTGTSYDITIGAKVDTTLPAGQYSNTFIITASANATNYSITYHANDEDKDGGSNDNATNIPSPTTGSTVEGTITLDTTTPTRAGYEFKGWCEGTTTTAGGRDTCTSTKVHQPGESYPLASEDNTLDLYAMWDELLLTDVIDATGQPITFKVGTGIEMIMVADSQTRTFTPEANGVTATTTTKWWPYYAIEGTNVTMNADPGNKYLITVVPQKNYKFARWEKSGTEWTAIGTTGSYITMQDPTLTQDKCKAAGERGMNVTDSRNNVSYTVGIVSNGNDFSRCWMYSNLRLEGGTHLTSADSDLGEGMEFDVPKSAKANDTVAGDGDVWVNYWTKKEMIECKGKIGKYAEVSGSNINSDGTCDENTNTITEFFYNWYAAIANDAVGSTPTSGGSVEEGSVENVSFDQQAKGSICPWNWRLMEEGAAGNSQLIADHNEIDAFAAAQNTNLNNGLGRLITSGDFWSGQQHIVGMRGRWWSASRHSDSFGRRLVLLYSGVYLDSNTKDDGESVRCILRDQQQ